MAVTPEEVVYHYLQSNCSAKIVQLFCKEMNFNPLAKKTVDELVSVNDIVKYLNDSKAKVWILKQVVSERPVEHFFQHICNQN